MLKYMNVDCLLQQFLHALIFKGGFELAEVGKWQK